MSKDTELENDPLVADIYKQRILKYYCMPTCLFEEREQK